MKLSTMMVIKAIVCLSFGVLLLFFPEFLTDLLDVDMGEGGILFTRLYGAALWGNFFLTWFSRNSVESEALRAAVLGLFVYDAIGLVVAVLATLDGVMGTLGWGIVGVYLFMTLGFGYFYFKK